MPSPIEITNCKRKTRFDSEPDAKKALERTKKHSPGKPLRIYKCSVCFRWHLTTKPKR